MKYIIMIIALTFSINSYSEDLPYPLKQEGDFLIAPNGDLYELVGEYQSFDPVVGKSKPKPCKDGLWISDPDFDFDTLYSNNPGLLVGFECGVRKVGSTKVFYADPPEIDQLPPLLLLNQDCRQTPTSAPPLSGLTPLIEVASHIGVVTFNISVSWTVDGSLTSFARWFSNLGDYKYAQFSKTIKVKTGNVVDIVQVQHYNVYPHLFTGVITAC